MRTEGVPNTMQCEVYILHSPLLCKVKMYTWCTQIDALGPAADVLVKGLQIATSHQDALHVLESAVQVHSNRPIYFVYTSIDCPLIPGG